MSIDCKVVFSRILDENVSLLLSSTEMLLLCFSVGYLQMTCFTVTPQKVDYLLTDTLMQRQTDYFKPACTCVQGKNIYLYPIPLYPSSPSHSQ